MNYKINKVSQKCHKNRVANLNVRIKNSANLNVRIKNSANLNVRIKKSANLNVRIKKSANLNVRIKNSTHKKQVFPKTKKSQITMDCCTIYLP